jgi:cell wall assembly regulator SMI1
MTQPTMPQQWEDLLTAAFENLLGRSLSSCEPNAVMAPTSRRPSSPNSSTLSITASTSACSWIGCERGSWCCVPAPTEERPMNDQDFTPDSCDMRERSIADLELSVRTFGFLQALGIETLGQMLDLPEIVIPPDWPVKIARMAGAEIEQAFHEAGVDYAGSIVAPPLAAASLKAEGDVPSRWATISRWLKAEHPEALAQFNPPAPLASIAAAEAKIGRSLPDDYKAFLAIHNGQSEFASMVGLGALLPVEKVAETWADMMGDDAPIDPEWVGEGVRAVDYSRGWIPITRSARGRDFLCIDLDPAPGGVRGQIVEYVVDDFARPLIAKSFADLLSLYFEQAQEGLIDFDEALAE